MAIDVFVFHVLVSIALAIVLLNIAALVHYFSGTEPQRYPFTFLVLDFEDNLGSWFSGCNLALTSFVLWNTFLSDRQESLPKSWGWATLAIVFALLSFDEIAAYHEWIAGILPNMDGALHYLKVAWFVPVSLVGAVLFLALLSFLRSLPAVIVGRFFLAGGIFVAGAVVLESITVRHWSNFGRSLGYYAGVTLEELCEIAGVLLFQHALLRYQSAVRQNDGPEVSLAEFGKILLRAAVAVSLLVLPYLAFVEIVSFSFPEEFMAAKNTPNTMSGNYIKTEKEKKSDHGRWSSSHVKKHTRLQLGDQVFYELTRRPQSGGDLLAFLGKGRNSGVFSIRVNGELRTYVDLCGRGNIDIPTGPVALGRVPSDSDVTRIGFRLIQIDTSCSEWPELIVDGFGFRKG